MIKKNDQQITILLNVYNAEKNIERFFKSLKKQTYNHFSILVIDDGSTDTTIKKINQYSSHFDIEIIKRPHQGLRKARSYGVKKASCDILIILDSDLILNSEAIEELIKSLNQNEKIAAVGGVLKNAEKGMISESYAELRTLFIKLRTEQKDFVDWVNGGFCALKKKVIDEIGGYTQQETSEDLDISWRIQKEGYKLALATKAIAFHGDPTTFKGIWRREYNTGKREYLLTKTHKKHSITIKRLIRFYPLILPLPIIVFLLTYWILVPLFLLISFIPPIIFLNGKVRTRLTAWFTFNVMNFAYCTGFILSFFKKSN